ncbi:MAG TPA: hypothetical protein VM659_06680, partial [Dongiaceae bacterium]|nr:hypothetical protein [Dongiaceae bacterium]
SHRDMPLPVTLELTPELFHCRSSNLPIISPLLGTMASSMSNGRSERNAVPFYPFYLTPELTIAYFCSAASIKANAGEISLKKLRKLTIKKSK